MDATCPIVIFSVTKVTVSDEQACQVGYLRCDRVWERIAIRFVDFRGDLNFDPLCGDAATITEWKAKPVCCELW